MGYDYAISSEYTLADGTAAYSAASDLVTGSGTTFLDKIEVGDVLYLNGHYRRVIAVNSDTEVQVDPDWDDAASGLTVVGYRMHNVETSLGLPAPKGVFLPYSQPLDLGDGSVRGAGWAQAEWRWGFLTQDQRDDLRDYVAGASAPVVIHTTTNEDGDDYAYFAAQAIWPAAEDRDAGRRKNFTLRFRALIEVP